MENEQRQQVVDATHLGVLSVCYFISAGLYAFQSLLGFVYIFMGGFFSQVLPRIPIKSEQSVPPFEWMGGFFMVFGVFFFLFFATLATLQVLTGMKLRQRESRTFCMIVACLSCILIPIGTALGVFTLIVLARPSVERIFEAKTEA
jgi:hypothetical protein